MKRREPYLSAFLLNNEIADSDMTTDVNSVHPVSVFAEITKMFAVGRSGDGGLNCDIEECFMAVLCRIA
jgi:Lon-like ATP-dependent protease